MKDVPVCAQETAVEGFDVLLAPRFHRSRQRLRSLQLLSVSFISVERAELCFCVTGSSCYEYFIIIVIQTRTCIHTGIRAHEYIDYTQPNLRTT